MANIIFPEEFYKQKDLLASSKSKHDADGTSSVLTPLLTQKSINLTTDTTAMNNAEVHDINQEQFYLDAEKNREQRDYIIDIVFSGTRGAVQFLKEYYKPNTRILGDWGITVDGENRVVYPTDFKKIIQFMLKFKAKHDSFPGTTSPLRPYLVEHGIEMTVVASALTAAQTYHTNYLKNMQDGEREVKLRDVLRNPVVKHLHDIGNYLMKLFRGTEQKIVDWGFSVDHSHREPVLRTSRIIAGDKLFINGIVLGSIFTNTGKTQLYVYKGRKIKGSYIVVEPGEELGMNRGFSAIVVVNPAAKGFGECETLRHK